MEMMFTLTRDPSSDIWPFLYDQPGKRKPMTNKERLKRRKARKVAKISRKKNRK